MSAYGRYSPTEGVRCRRFDCISKTGLERAALEGFTEVLLCFGQNCAKVILGTFFHTLAIALVKLRGIYQTNFSWESI